MFEYDGKAGRRQPISESTSERVRAATHREENGAAVPRNGLASSLPTLPGSAAGATHRPVRGHDGDDQEHYRPRLVGEAQRDGHRVHQREYAG